VKHNVNPIVAYFFVVFFEHRAGLCIIFNWDNCWCRACVDTSESGDLASCDLLGEYSLTQDFATLTKSDQLNYSINVHEGGNILEIVSMCCEYN